MSPHLNVTAAMLLVVVTLVATVVGLATVVFASFTGSSRTKAVMGGAAAWVAVMGIGVQVVALLT